MNKCSKKYLKCTDCTWWKGGTEGAGRDEGVSHLVPIKLTNTALPAHHLPSVTTICTVLSPSYVVMSGKTKGKHYITKEEENVTPYTIIELGIMPTRTAIKPDRASQREKRERTGAETNRRAEVTTEGRLTQNERF
ncbi:hypothetical protein Pmani_018186 [Petrolisthes manimaculis]|uniref:Uncharacterized protein n=1 Tax=Petrolisthes manimaculis TaxID=1843537 RepID=A0AAE1PLH4_9EUCA|nr:hypothetical protein Pmani_018186 [Petrolisthes manimaculis]